MNKSTGRAASFPGVSALIEAGLITREQADVALEAAVREEDSLADAIRHNGLTDERAARRILPSLEYPVLDLSTADIESEAVQAVPAALGRRHSVIPIAFEGDGLVVAMPDPTNVIALDDIRTVSGREVLVVLADPDSIEEVWLRYVALDRSAETLLSEVGDEEDDDDDAHELEKASGEDAPIVRALNQMITQAVQQRASDMHIEPNDRDVRVRYRLDGVLHEVMRIPKRIHAGVTSRLKVMADMNIAERRVPQDGRMTMKVEGAPTDFRVATVPSVWGEEVIIRILNQSSSILTLEDLGFAQDTLERYNSSFRKPSGAILVVGPTGSGKSTTLYSTLAIVNDPVRKIITVEDPVETRMNGLSQIQVNGKAGLTFANALRSILRSDPDIVMVGEIRDTETARIAIEAAMTGHLVFSTLHTNDAPSSVTRLTEMGVEPFLVASAIDCVLAQRLARRLCQRCREPYEPRQELLREVGFTPGEYTFFRPTGCNNCAGTGYKGRVALVELMMVTEEIERLVVDRASSDVIRRVAIEQGMRTLREDGLRKVEDGASSLEEILRIVEGRSDIIQQVEEAAVVEMDRFRTGSEST